MGQIDLPSRLNFQTSARDLEFHTALKKIVYPEFVPTPFFYPRSQYGVAGLGANCIPYDFYALQQAFGVVDCGQAPYTSDPATQYACKQANDPKLQAIALLSPSYGTCITPDMIPGPYTPSPGSAGDPASNPSAGGLYYVPIGGGAPVFYPSNPTGTVTYPAGGGTPTVIQTSAPPSSSGSPSSGGSSPAQSQQSYSPTVSFIPSRSGTLYPGDTWQLHIQGGKPGAVVSVTGTQNGVTNTNQMGATDQNGNWSTSGTIDASSVGNWFEVWYVGGQMAASPFSFNVASPNSPASGGNTGTQTGGTQSSTPPPSSGGMTQTQTPAPSSSDGMIFGVPQNYVLMGGAAILLLVVMGGRR